MSKIYTSADQLIGHTPLLELTHIEKEADLKATVLAKLEYFNPANNFCINDDSSGTLSDIILSCCPLQTESCETAIILYYLNNRTDLYWGKISNRYWSFQPQSITPFFLSA